MSVSGSWIVSFCAVGLAGLVGCGGSSSNTSPVGGGSISPTAVTYTFTGAAPTAVATKIGSGAFTQATLQSGTLTLSIPSGTTNYAIALLCPPITVNTPSSLQESVLQRSTLDGTSFSGAFCYNSTPPQQGLATLQVNATAIPGAASVYVWGSGNTSLGGRWSGGTLNLNGQIAAGTYDVLVVVYDSTVLNPLAVRILRSQTIPGTLNGGNPVVFTASDETLTGTITYKNVPSGSHPTAPPYVSFFTSGGAIALEQPFQFLVPATQYTDMPAGAVQSGDYFTFNSTVYTGASGGNVNVDMTTATGGAQTITYPPAWTYSGPSAARLPTFDFNYSGFSAMSHIQQIATVRWNQGTTSQDSISVAASQSYQNGATSVSIPDLSGLTGFLAPAPSGSSVSWYADVQQGYTFQTTPPIGTVQTVSNSGTYTEP